MPRDTGEEPRTFPGDPHPPVQVPAFPSPAAAAEPKSASSGGGGAPTSVPPKEEAPYTPPQVSYSVVQRKDGTRDVFLSSDREPMTKVGTVNIPDADHVLNAVSKFDPDAKMWDRVPADTAKSLLSGRLGVLDSFHAQFTGGEASVVRGLAGSQALYGRLSDDEARAKGDMELIKAQLTTAPQMAWSGGHGEWAGKAAGFLANMTPFGLEVGKRAAEYGVSGAGMGLGAAGAVSPLLAGTGPYGVAAAAGLVAGGFKLGAETGTFKATMDVMAGNSYLDLLDKGVEPKAARVSAITSGVLQGALMVGQFNVLSAPLKRVFAEKVLADGAVSKVLASSIVAYAKNTGSSITLVEAQKAVDMAVGNLTALATDRPDLLQKHPLNELANTLVTAGPAMAMANVPGAALGAMLEGKGAKGPSEESAPMAAPEPPAPVPRENAASFLVGGEPERPVGASSQTPLETAGEGLPQSPAPEGKAAEKVSLPSDEKSIPGEPAKVKPPYDPAKVNSYEATAAHRALPEEKSPEQTVGRMKGEADEMRERLSSPTMPAENKQWLAESVARHERDITVLEKGPERAAESRKYVLDQGAVDAAPKESDAKTAENLRYEREGRVNAQVAHVNQMVRDFEKEVTDPVERGAVTRWVDVGGDRAALRAAADNESLSAASRAEYRAALDLSPASLKWARAMRDYAAEWGEVGKDVGLFKSVRENYVARLYQPEKPEDFVKNELQGLRRSTRHAQQRVYATMEDAELAGKKFQTTEAPALWRLHNEEIARAAGTRQVFDAMEENGLGAWKRQDNVPEGWTRVGNLEKAVPIKDKEGNPVLGEDGNQLVSHSIFAAPEGIAEGLAALADPNYVKKIDTLREAGRYQGLVKTFNLGWGFVHHLNLFAQAAYHGDVGMMLKSLREGNLETPEFKELEVDAVKHSAETAVTSDNQDFLRKLTRDEGDTFSKVVNLPGVKQLLERTDKNANFLFGRIQRYLKVMEFHRLSTDWLADHREAGDEEVTTAKRAIARHVNDKFGGQSWGAIGMTKSNLSLLRLAMLAPDYTYSNLHMLSDALTKWGGSAEKTSGALARAHIVRGLAVGMAGTEALNIMMTGHSTEHNSPGHKLEVEVQPGVYVSLLRGPLGDITRLASMVGESGAAGAVRFVQSKGSPLTRTAVGLAANVNYSGRQAYRTHAGPVAGTYDVLKFLLESASPVPFGVSNLMQYAESRKVTPLGAAVVATNVGRYSQGPKKEKK